MHPIPFGPYILWPVKDSKLIFINLTFIGIFPAAYAQSEWKYILFFLHNLPI